MQKLIKLFIYFRKINKRKTEKIIFKNRPKPTFLFDFSMFYGIRSHCHVTEVGKKIKLKKTKQTKTLCYFVYIKCLSFN